MDTISHFTYFNEQTKNNIAGITYHPNTINNNKYQNTTPYHFVFAHATGFCKEIFVDLVNEFRLRGISSPITSVDHANHGESTHGLPCDWHLCALDLYAVIQNVIHKNDPNKILIGVGHSMGGTVSAFVEVAHPNTYGCLILLEPVLPAPPYQKLDSDLAKMTMKRKSVFPNKESVKASFSMKFPFNLWTKGSLDSYVEHGFKHSTIDGKEVVELKLSKEEEAEFYRMGSAHGGFDLIPKMQIPFLILKGTESTFPGGFYDKIIERSKTGYYKEIQGGTHFFPMEKPEKVAEEAINFIKTHLKSGPASKL